MLSLPPLTPIIQSYFLWLLNFFKIFVKSLILFCSEDFDFFSIYVQAEQNPFNENTDLGLVSGSKQFYNNSL